MRFVRLCLLPGLFGLFLLGNVAFSEDTPAAETAAPAAEAPAAAPVDPRATPKDFNGADTTWMLISSALVLMMTAPGLAMFYCGLVRKKNVLGVMMQCFFLMGLMSVIWALYGYSLAFAPDVLGGFCGGTDYMLLKGVLPTYDFATKVSEVPMAGTIPRSLHMVYQMMFFIITPALICGAYAERMKFSTMVVFTILWGTFIYCPVAHWVWSDQGWLNAFYIAVPGSSVTEAPFPALDFAGGTVVHITSGISALVCALVLGKRLGHGQEPMPPHNLTYTCIGAALLWVGWFGFNGGSALAANPLAVNAFVATHLAAAAGTLAWAGAEWVLRGKPSILGACSGAVAGLVVITPAAGSVSPLSGIVMGVIAGLVCFQACNLKNKFGYDDALDAFGVHGVGGTLGAVLTGVFATAAVIPGKTDPMGLLEGNSKQIVNQVVGAGVSIVIAVVGTLILLKILDSVMGLRVSQQDELQGLDVSQHGEEGYIFL
ncbi:MAG: ammonium transporter [Planctomycetes bacterium]|nr:ammonium transporter [Planctomycetota bacterium]